MNALRVALRIVSGIIIFICSFETPAGVSKLLFHGRVCKGKQHLQRRFLRKRGAAGERLLPLGGAVAQRRRGFESAEPEKRLKDLHAEQA